LKNSNTTKKINRIIFKTADLRVFVSRIFGLVVLILLLFTGHSLSQEGIIDKFFEMSGVFLLSVCSLGRLWALMYLTGYKSDRIITEGPYSMVRNPLYIFTFIGVVGIGLSSENLLILVLVIIYYLLYYPVTIISEEKKLTAKFGQDYIEYLKRTPRFIPKLSLYREPEKFEVKTAKFVKNFLDAMWFIWIFPVLHFIEMLQDSGILPVIWRIP